MSSTILTDTTAKRGNEQFPVDIKVVRGVRFETDSGDLMRIVVMSGHEMPRYQCYREYHYGNTTVSVELVPSFVMRSSTVEPSEQAIEAFAQGMSSPLNIPQVVSFCCGIHTPFAAHARLFKAVDPDDNTKMMGLLIEQDAQGKLLRVTWYKTWAASSAFRLVPDTLAFTLVKNEQGLPSLNPADIGGWTWFFSTSLGIGLSAPNITA